MTTIQTILAIFLLLLAAYIVVMNWICVVVSTRNQKRGIKRHISMIPLISGIATVGAYLIFPHPNGEWMFVIPLLDLSSWSLMLLPFYLLRASIRKATTEKDSGGHGG